MISALITAVSLMAGPVPVRIEGKPGNYTLLRGGLPYEVRGVGGTRLMEELVQMGGNSMRTWGTGEDTAATSDKAQSRGVTIMMGIWLGHQSYFNCKDPAKIAEQKREVLGELAKYKDHPALLVWGIGNEMDIDNDTPELWTAIEDIVREAKKIDPHHPFATVVAEISPEKISNIRRFCPSLDLLGINSYAGFDSLPKRIREVGWTKPYLLTEFGANGPWEVKKTDFGLPYELNSSEKADLFRKRYREGVMKGRGRLLGSFAFIWQDSKEVPGWFDTHLPGNIRSEQVDALQEVWTGGKKRGNRAPRILMTSCDVSGKTISPEAMITASITLKDPDNDPLSYRWEVRRDAGDSPFGGQGPEPQPLVVNGPADGQMESSTRFKAPREPGKYRVYVRAYDGHGNGATANWPFQVK
ncbi:MAG: hypothetical protein C4320_03615 [Armatimonadota bacterium]